MGSEGNDRLGKRDGDREREKHHSEEHNNYTDVTGRKHWIEK